MRDEEWNRMFEQAENRTLRGALTLGAALAVMLLLLALVGGI